MSSEKVAEDTGIEAPFFGCKFDIRDTGNVIPFAAYKVLLSKLLVVVPKLSSRLPFQILSAKMVWITNHDDEVSVRRVTGRFDDGYLL